MLRILDFIKNLFSDESLENQSEKNKLDKATKDFYKAKAKKSIEHLILSELSSEEPHQEYVFNGACNRS